MLVGMPSLVRMRARSTGRALELDRSALRAVISGDSELSDILMRAFILRRGALISTEQGDVVLLGSRHSAGTLRAQEFLTRNGHPHATIDVERDPTAQACATAIEARLCGSDEVIIVGGGNSAGQAAVYLAHTARKVNILVRGKGLADTMSRYLIQRIHDTPNIELRVETEIVELAGDDHLERVTSRDRRTGERATQPIRHVFMMTGASLNTEWLSGCVVLDRNGFIKTGPDLTRDDLAGARWPLARPPLLFETSLPGVFAVGDVRASSVKRVASAVGEGSICIQLVHKVLAE